MTMQTQPPPRQLAATQDVKSLLTTRWRQYITSPSSARLALSAQPYSGLSGVVAAVATQEQQSSALELLIRQLGNLDEVHGHEGHEPASAIGSCVAEHDCTEIAQQSSGRCGSQTVRHICWNCGRYSGRIMYVQHEASEPSGNRCGCGSGPACSGGVSAGAHGRPVGRECGLRPLAAASAEARWARTGRVCTLPGRESVQGSGPRRSREIGPTNQKDHKKKMEKLGANRGCAKGVYAAMLRTDCAPYGPYEDLDS